MNTMKRSHLKTNSKYHAEVVERYSRASRKKQKSQILDKYCRMTGLSRKYAIRKMGVRSVPSSGGRQPRKEQYDTQFVEALARIWSIFDYPCGQRLKPILEREVDRLVKFGELNISGQVASKLKAASSATINRKLSRHRKELLTRITGDNSVMSSAFERPDSVSPSMAKPLENNGAEAYVYLYFGRPIFGNYLRTINITEGYSNWWEGEAIIGNSREDFIQAVEKIRERSPFKWKGLISCNRQEWISVLLSQYFRGQNLYFDRSLGRRNNNAYIELGKWLCVGKHYENSKWDTLEEITILNDLFSHELRLFRNYFQPVIKSPTYQLEQGKARSRIPQTPYQRLMESSYLPIETKDELANIYHSLNPVQLKRTIVSKLNKLCQVSRMIRRAQ